MANGDEESRKAIEAEFTARLASQQEGTTASASLPYTRYIMVDTHVPEELPPSLRAVVYDKEFGLSFLTDEEILWARIQLVRSEIMFKSSRPALACNQKEEILLSALPLKSLVKLARSRKGFERKQQTTQTVIKRVEATTATPATGKGSRWKIFGRGKG